MDQPTLRVMTLNVLLGGEGRFPALCALVGRAAPDLLVLEECLGWEDGQRLGAMAAALGLPPGWPHAVLGEARPRPSGRRYHVAVVSRWPLLRAQPHNDPRHIGHCLLRCGLRAGPLDIELLAAHFDAHGEDLRLREVRYLGDLLGPEPLRGHCLLAGDLNALSRRDPYPAELPSLLAAAGVDKYGHPPRFDVMDALYAAGWVDALAAAGGGRWETARRGGRGVQLGLRTDYILASPPLAARLRRAQVLETGGASDHEAVVAEFAL